MSRWVEELIFWEVPNCSRLGGEGRGTTLLSSREGVEVICR